MAKVENTNYYPLELTRDQMTRDKGLSTTD